MFISNKITGEILQARLTLMEEPDRVDTEAWVVNSVKINMLARMDRLLGAEGRNNLRELLLVPIFTMSDMDQRVKAMAPELGTIYYQELVRIVEKLEKKLLSSRK